jgi:hypothetical protein
VSSKKAFFFTSSIDHESASDCKTGCQDQTLVPTGLPAMHASASSYIGTAQWSFFEILMTCVGRPAPLAPCPYLHLKARREGAGPPLQPLSDEHDLLRGLSRES